MGTRLDGLRRTIGTREIPLALGPGFAADRHAVSIPVEIPVVVTRTRRKQLCLEERTHLVGMLRHDVAEDLRDDELAPGYVRPAYDDYCFANVPGTVADLVGLDGVIGGPRLPNDTLPTTDKTRIAIVLVDGFGFEQFLCHRDAHPFLDHLAEEAVVTPLTSTFPSETAAAMTTYYLGRPPIQHGLLGWNVYRPDIDIVVKPLPFVTAGDGDPTDFGLSPADLRDGTSSGHRLSSAGVDVHRVVPEELIGDETALGVDGRQTYYGYAIEDHTELTDTLLRALNSASDPGFVHTYIPEIDAAGHAYGTTASAYREGVVAIFSAIEQAIRGIATERARETLLIVCADHGHVDTDPERNVDLLSAPAVADAVGETAEGTPRISGSPRNIHLHVEDLGAARDAVEAALAERGCDALVLTCTEAIDEGLWGPGEPSATFTRHCGDLLVIPDELGVWHAGEADELDLVGMHGGCHPDEMIVPFAVARADRLQ